ncbi:MAG: energy-coupling factor transporter ATPase [Erysipelotrichaceae bacterium]|nr:energy-coupling factor transporter ATPase [Erysipelotrichaceae bacterium]
MAIIEVRDLVFSYNQQEGMTIDHVSFDVPEGSYTTIIGHNGSGKSTIAKLLAGLLEKASGSIRIDGLELNLENLAKIRSRIGIVFQNPDNQFIGATVEDDIAFGLENHNVPQADMQEIIKHSAERVRMTKYLHQEPTRLSGGQKQRVAIAGVLAMKPKLLIFDEATAMLDPQGKDEIKKVIMDIHQETGLTVLSITHDIDEIAQADYVIALVDGQIVSTGSPEEIFFNEEKLKKIQLDVPFSMKLSAELEKLGIHTEKHITMEGLVEELCRYNSKM